MKIFIKPIAICASILALLIGCDDRSEDKKPISASLNVDKKLIFEKEKIYKFNSTTNECVAKENQICASKEEFQNLCESITLRSRKTNAALIVNLNLPQTFVDAADYSFETSWDPNHKYNYCRMTIRISGVLNGNSYSNYMNVGVSEIYVAKDGQVMAAESSI